MRARLADDEVVAVDACALRRVEAVVDAVQAAVRLDDEDAVVARVADEQPRRCGIARVGGHASREGELARGRAEVVGDLAAARLEDPREVARRVGLIALGDQRPHRRGDLDRVPLPRPARGLAARRVDEHERRPRAHRVGVPRGERGVVEHGVLEAHPRRRRLDRRVLALVGELRGVHAEDDEVAREAPLDPAQLLGDVVAVHAARGEEVQQDDVAAQLGEGRAVPTDPTSRPDELGGAHADAVHGVQSDAPNAPVDFPASTAVNSTHPTPAAQLPPLSALTAHMRVAGLLLLALLAVALARPAAGRAERLDMRLLAANADRAVTTDGRYAALPGPSGALGGARDDATGRLIAYPVAGCAPVPYESLVPLGGYAFVRCATAPTTRMLSLRTGRLAPIPLGPTESVFGDVGRSARSAVGVAALPLGAPVEVEVVAALSNG